MAEWVIGGVKDRCGKSEEIIGIADAGTDVCADDVSS
jgi:hypothetical protein